MKRTFLILVMAIFVLSSCDQSEKTGEAGRGDSQSSMKTEYLVGFSQCTIEDPWRVHMNEQIKEAAAKHLEIELIIANGENRNAKQIADVENFIVRGVDAIIISPREAAPLTPAVERAYDRGIPVVVLDRKVLGEKYSVFIGASNREIGKKAGEYIVDKLGGDGKVVEIQGILGATATIERHEGFREAIKDTDIEVIYDQSGDYKRNPAKQIMDNALQALEDIDAVYAHNDEMAIGAFLAAKAVGRQDEMIFAGIDGQGEAVSMIRAGDLDATFVYPNGAAEAVDLVLRILHGETVPKQVTLDTTRVTKNENLDIKGF